MITCRSSSVSSSAHSKDGIKYANDFPVPVGASTNANLFSDSASPTNSAIFCWIGRCKKRSRCCSRIPPSSNQADKLGCLYSGSCGSAYAVDSKIGLAMSFVKGANLLKKKTTPMSRQLNQMVKRIGGVCPRHAAAAFQSSLRALPLLPRASAVALCACSSVTPNSLHRRSSENLVISGQKMRAIIAVSRI